MDVRKSSNRLAAVASLTAMVALSLLLALSNSARAQEIIACEKKSNGDLREVTETSECKKSETAVMWAELGPTGPSGPQGVAGPTGPSGAAGPTGPTGLTTGWQLTGNAGTSASDFLGTTDTKPLMLDVESARVMLFQAAATNSDGDTAPNVIGGASNNVVDSGVQGATIAGGGGTGDGGAVPNTVSADWGTVCGGQSNTASNLGSVVAGGFGNTASGPTSGVLSGNGNTASALNSIVLGGFASSSTAQYALAGGAHAQALNQGSFIWADTTSAENFDSVANNEFASRSTGGVRFVTAVNGSGAPTAGVMLGSGDSSWASISDRNAKANFAPVDTEDLLRRLAAIPVTTWNYKTQDPSIRHIGPMAQDFSAAFKVGADDKHITTVDADGVSLAAIQGMYRMLQKKDAEIASLRSEIDALKVQQKVLAHEVRAINLQQTRLEAFPRNETLMRANAR